MKRIIQFATILLISSLILGCGRRVISENGHSIFKNKPRRYLSENQDPNWTQLLDTNALYLYASENTEEFFKFCSNGVVKAVLVSRNTFTNEDFILPENSINRLDFLIEGNKIKIDRFYSGEPTPVWNNWERNRFKGTIKRDTINLNSSGWKEIQYIKSQDYFFENGKVKTIERK